MDITNSVYIGQMLLILLLFVANRSIFGATISQIEQAISEAEQIPSENLRNSGFETYPIFNIEQDPIVNYAFRGNKRQFKGLNFLHKNCCLR